MPYNFTLPFRLTTGSGGYFEVTNDVLSATASNIRSVLVTNWGERPMHYRFGCNLREFLFEPRTDVLRRRLADRVIQQMAEWMPFITISELNVLFTEDDASVRENQVGIRLVFRFSEDPRLAGQVQLTI